jgi:HEAT repeat protein
MDTTKQPELNPAQVIALIERDGREGREYVQQVQAPGKIGVLCEAIRSAAAPHVRHVICNIFATLRDPAALECLLDALGDASPEVVAAAADAIGNCSFDMPVPGDLQRRLGERLLELFSRSPEVSVRSASIYALGLMRMQTALSRLIDALDDEAPVIRCCAAEALAHIQAPEARPALRRRMMHETDPRVQRYLRLALDELKERSGQ